MELLRFCPFDEKPLARMRWDPPRLDAPGDPGPMVSGSFYRCSDCGMPFASVLLKDDELWDRFRAETERRVALCRDGGMTDEEIRPGLGVLFLAALESVQ